MITYSHPYVSFLVTYSISCLSWTIFYSLVSFSICGNILFSLVDHLQSKPFLQPYIYRYRNGPVSVPWPDIFPGGHGCSSSQRWQGTLALVGDGGGVSRSLGTAGQLGDAASGRCSPCRDWGLLDDHPAAAVALCRPPAQRTAPCLAPETQGGWFYCLSALCNDLCTGVLMKKVQCTTPEWRLLGCLLVPEDS